ncbi:MAG: hypothetical protein IT286_04925 [Proteobacteria bacterium]|nr:hypothetical protein [Pseudomonadota bacterium]
MKRPNAYPFKVTVNGYQIKKVLIGRHYLLKHSHYMNDDLILELVARLDGGNFPVDSSTDGIEYYAADIEFDMPIKIYRLIWLFEGKNLEVLGVIHAYRRKKRRK